MEYLDLISRKINVAEDFFLNFTVSQAQNPNKITPTIHNFFSLYSLYLCRWGLKTSVYIPLHIFSRNEWKVFLQSICWKWFLYSDPNINRPFQKLKIVMNNQEISKLVIQSMNCTEYGYANGRFIFWALFKVLRKITREKKNFSSSLTS